FYALYASQESDTTNHYPLSLHDALPISLLVALVIGDRAHDERGVGRGVAPAEAAGEHHREGARDAGEGRTVAVGDAGIGVARGSDRKSTRLNSSHVKISYAVFCL